MAANHLDYEPVQFLPCHAIDLKKDGELNAHVDSIKFSGDLVAGISLLSSCIMRLIPDDDGHDNNNNNNNNSNNNKEQVNLKTTNNGGVGDDRWVDLYLPPLSLYVLTGVGRFNYSHQLLPDKSEFTTPDGQTIIVPREHRLSVIFRDTKN